jgi:hypothetical protein
LSGDLDLYCAKSIKITLGMKVFMPRAVCKSFNR